MATVQRLGPISRENQKLTDPIVQLAEAEVALLAGDYNRAFALKLAGCRESGSSGDRVREPNS